MDEIEYTVAAGVQSGDEGRPSHGTLGWNGCPQAVEVPLPPQRRQVRQGIPMPLEEPGIHAVHAEDDQAMGCRRAVPAPLGEKEQHDKPDDGGDSSHE